MRKVKVEEVHIDKEKYEVRTLQYVSSTPLLTKYDKVKVTFPKMIEDVRKGDSPNKKPTENDWERLLNYYEP